MSERSTRLAERRSSLASDVRRRRLVSRPVLYEASLIHWPESLAEILLRASVLSGDRRKVRYPRLRKAVEAGLEDRSVLSAKQPKGKKRQSVNNAVTPDLPDEVTARLSRKIGQD